MFHLALIALQFVMPAPSAAMGPQFNCKAPTHLLSDTTATVRVCEVVKHK